MSWLALAVFVFLLLIFDRRSRPVQLARLSPLQRLVASSILKNRD
jgi:hypothetical protein